MRNTRFKRVRRDMREGTGKGAQLLERNLTEASYEDVAKAMGISVARVGQIEVSALARLRECFSLIESGVAIEAAIERCKGRTGRPRKVAP